jgi:hypothetical protein
MPIIILEKEKEPTGTIRNIIISDALKEVLLKIDKSSHLNYLLLSGEVKESELSHPEKNFNYLDLSHSNKGHISYLTQEKIDKIEAEDKDYWEPKMRYTARPGSIMKKLFKTNSSEIEYFASQFLAIVDPPVFHMKVVKGNDISKFYQHNNYYQQSGSLGASCMKCSPANYFDIYTQNEDKISMLLMLDQYDKVMGRAILWNGNDFKLLDRIYVCNDNYLYYFYNWAKENSCFYKEENTWYTPKNIMYDGEKTIKEFEISLKNVDFEKYPYMDTFKWLDKKEGKIYNYIPKGKMQNFIVLGDHMGRYFDSDYFAFCEYSHVLCLSRDLAYLDYLDMNVSYGMIVHSYVLDTNILREHYVFNEEIGDNIFNEEYDRFNDKEKIEKLKSVIEEKRKKGLELKKTWSSSIFDLKVEPEPVAYSDGQVSSWEEISNKNPCAEQILHPGRYAGIVPVDPDLACEDISRSMEICENSDHILSLTQNKILSAFDDGDRNI